MEKKQPVTKFRSGLVTATVWQNVSKEGRKFNSVVLENSYKDDLGWHKTNNLSKNDVSAAILVLSKALEAVKTVS